MTREAAELAERNQGLAHFALLRFLRQHDIPRAAAIDKEDLLSEALFALCRAASAYSPDRGITFASYAVAAIRNALLTACGLRHYMARAPEFISLEAPEGDGGKLGDLLADPGPGPDDLGALSATGTVKAALAGLPSPLRNVVDLVDLQGLSAAATSRALRISVGEVHYLQMRAHWEMRRALEAAA